MISSIMPTYNRAPLNFVKGEGSWLIEARGQHFLDFGAGIAVNALGHAHPALVARLTEQAQKLWHVSNLYNVAQQQDLADKLVNLTFADTVFFTNSGTESCELAVKMARKYWYEKGHIAKFEIIAFEGAFHGRSSAAIAATNSEKLVKGFGPMLPGFKQVDWANSDHLEAAINQNTAAIIIEPIQGEGGIRPLPNNDLKRVRKLCDKHEVLLILDEVQCGVGRSGRLFAHEWSGIVPDIMMIAKGIGGGFPLGAVLASEDAAFGMTSGSHGSTYGGNPLACAVGSEVLDHVSDLEFLDNVSRKGTALMRELMGLVERFPDIFLDARGLGLMLGLKCKVPNTEIMHACFEQKLITVPAADNVIRLLPPLNISDHEIDEALQRLAKAAQTCTDKLNEVVV